MNSIRGNSVTGASSEQGDRRNLFVSGNELRLRAANFCVAFRNAGYLSRSSYKRLLLFICRIKTFSFIYSFIYFLLVQKGVIQLQQSKK